MPSGTPSNGKPGGDRRQGDFFTQLFPDERLIEEPQGTDSGFDARLRELLNLAIKASPLNRDEIAELLTERVGRRITKAQLDSWTGASHANRFPAELIPALCAVLGNTILLAGLVEAAGCRLIEGEELKLARLGQLWLFVRQAEEEQRRILQTLPLFRNS